MIEELIIRCEDSLDGIFSAIYEAFVQKKMTGDSWGENISIQIGEGGNYSLFSSEIDVETDTVKAQKVIESIQNKIGYQAYDMIFAALCHFDPDRATVVFRYLIRGYRVGARIQEYLSEPYVIRVMEMSRKVGNEADKMKGFLRFRDIGNYLFAEIEPKCNLIPFIIYHFEDRYPNENFVIYDHKRKFTAVHQQYRQSVFVQNQELHQNLESGRDEFELLWKQYFTTMEIQPRHNERCQNTLCPKWYRTNMIEFG